MTGILSGNSNINRALELLRAGGVIIYPTETVYGFGCDPFDEAACTRVQGLKKRAELKPLLLLASRRKQVEDMAGVLESTVSRLADRFWPGPLTIVFRPSIVLPSWLIGPSGGVAFRVTPDPLASALIEAFGRPLVSTSANKSGMPPLSTGEEASVQFGSFVDMILSGGVRDGVPSTIIDVTGSTPVILREGGISQNDLNEVF